MLISYTDNAVFAENQTDTVTPVDNSEATMCFYTLKYWAIVGAYFGRAGIRNVVVHSNESLVTLKKTFKDVIFHIVVLLPTYMSVKHILAFNEKYCADIRNSVNPLLATSLTIGGQR